jgi:hypothetical protein
MDLFYCINLTCTFPVRDEAVRSLGSLGFLGESALASLTFFDHESGLVEDMLIVQIRGTLDLYTRNPMIFPNYLDDLSTHE